MRRKATAAHVTVQAGGLLLACMLTKVHLVPRHVHDAVLGREHVHGYQRATRGRVLQYRHPHSCQYLVAPRAYVHSVHSVHSEAFVCMVRP